MVEKFHLALIEFLGDDSPAGSPDGRHTGGAAAKIALAWLAPESTPYLEAALGHANLKVRTHAELALAAVREWQPSVVRMRGQNPPPTREAFDGLFMSLGNNTQGYPEYIHRPTGMVFVRLPGGTFFMGSSDDDPAARDTDEAPPDAPGDLVLRHEERCQRDSVTGPTFPEGMLHSFSRILTLRPFSGRTPQSCCRFFS